MKNTGFEYEILVQTIFQEIIKQEFAKNVTIRRDVKLLGKSGARHQIDVFWEFEIGGILYSTIVQVKDWKNSVKQEQILALKGVLDDLPRQPRGIIVTKKGFQRGAKKVAENHGIELFELKEIPKPLPLLLMPDSFANLYVSLEEGYFETIVYQVKYTNTTLILKNNCRDKSIITGRKYTCETLENSNLLDEFFYDSSFFPIKTFGKVMSDVANSTHKDA